MIKEILGETPKTIPVTAYTDNRSVIEAVYSTNMVDDKMLHVDIAAIRESLETNSFNEIKWCSGDIQLANCMPKQGASGYQLLDVLQNGKLNKDFLP